MVKGRPFGAAAAVGTGFLLCGLDALPTLKLEMRGTLVLSSALWPVVQLLSFLSGLVYTCVYLNQCYEYISYPELRYMSTNSKQQMSFKTHEMIES